MKLRLVLHNIRSAYNVGAILRTAEGLGVEKVVFSGYTPRYDDMNLLPHLREKLNRQIGKAALGAEEMVARECVEDLGGWLGEQECVVVGLENNLSNEENGRKVVLGKELMAFSEARRASPSSLRSDSGASPRNIPSKLGCSLGLLPDSLRARRAACSLVSSAPSQAGNKHSPIQTSTASPQNMILILGEEVRGIPAEIRERCDYFLEIPMRGRKESFNVSVAAGIAIWELMR